MNFCCLFLESPAPELVEAVYRRDPWLRSAPYQLQHDALLAAHLGASGHAPLLARQPGPQARHLIVNCPQLLQAWRGEQKDGPPHPDSLILEQVERLAPQVVCLCEPLLAGPELVMSLRRRVKLLAARHHGAAPPRLAPGYDLVLTPFPQQNISGTACYYSPLCHRGPLAGRFLPFEMRAIDVSFVGELWARHTGKQRFLEHLARTSPILFWGEGVELLPPGSPIHPRYRGPAKGDELTKILGYSRITVNRHADADRCAWNGRLFEATAAGTLLVTDYHDNLPELFEVGKEVVAYHSPAQCRELIDYYLRHPEEAEAVARAGQARTLRDHSYARRVGEAVALFRQHLSIMEAA